MMLQNQIVLNPALTIYVGVNSGKYLESNQINDFLIQVFSVIDFLKM